MADAKPTLVQSLFTHKLVFWISLAVFLVADLATKAWATAAVKPTGDAITPVLPGLAWKWAENEGAAFSMFHGRVGFLVVVAASVLAVVVWYAFRANPKRWTFLLALGLVASGAIGNLYDRISLGAVRDFIFFDFDLPLWGERSLLGFHFEIPRRWPIFNVADIAIFVGVGILMVHSFRKEETPAAHDKPATTGEATPTPAPASTAPEAEPAPVAATAADPAETR